MIIAGIFAIGLIGYTLSHTDEETSIKYAVAQQGMEVCVMNGHEIKSAISHWKSIQYQSSTSVTIIN